MNIIWSEDALADLKHIQAYIEYDNVIAASETVLQLLIFTEKQLSIFPKSGRIGNTPGTLELVVPRLPYVIPYRLNDSHIEIIRVYHTSQVWPESYE